MRPTATTARTCIVLAHQNYRCVSTPAAATNPIADALGRLRISPFINLFVTVQPPPASINH
jgi:hypothetical protein